MTMTRVGRSIAILAMISLCFLSGAAFGARLKDIASVKGVRENQLWGYGIVVGLAGTGDSRHVLTESSLNMFLKGMGVDLKTQKVETKNTAAVLVTATLKPFAGSGSVADVVVSSIGTATSLEGGTLAMTPLQGADGKVYAISQGKVITNLRTGKGTKFLRQSMVTGYIPDGATLERELPQQFSSQRTFRFLLNTPDFTTSARAAHRINEELGSLAATALDSGTIDVILPEGHMGNPVALMAQLENVDVETDSRAKIVINQRTGTVIMGEHVRVSPAAIAHNNLRIEIAEPPVTPPVPGAQAPSDTAPPPRQISSVGRDLDNPSGMGSMLAMKSGATVSDVVASLNALGASPDDLVLILQSLKSAGALTAEVITR